MGRNTKAAVDPAPTYTPTDREQQAAQRVLERRQDHALAHGLLVEHLVGALGFVELEAVRDELGERQLVLGDEAGAVGLADLAQGTSRRYSCSLADKRPQIRARRPREPEQARTTGQLLATGASWRWCCAT